MFVLQGAPGVFQELVEILATKCKQDAQVKKILQRGHLASFSMLSALVVIQFRKLNSRTKSHAAYLPNMEILVESLAKCRYKSKLDMRSGFWQVGLTDRAKNLSTFCIPSGRCFRPLCMMFGLQGAPGVFQELMEILSTQAKQDPQVRKIMQQGHLASFFDDTGIGSQTIDEHYILLEKYFEICRTNNVRIKLSKCEFLKENIDYLGFSMGWGTWKPSETRMQAIQKREVKRLKELRSFWSNELLPTPCQDVCILISTTYRFAEEKC